RARGLSKVFRIYDRPQDRLWEMLRPGGPPRHREFSAVRGLDLEVWKGETVGIVGRNGSGKSTLLRLLCGTLERSCGELEVRGHLAPLLTLGAGFNRDFTGRENVMMNGAILGMSRREIEGRLPSIVEFADIGTFFDRPVKSYSAGMVSRLAFAVAVNSDPEILVIDEVLAVGDEAFNRKCFARIEEIKRSGSTILFVSHVAERVIELCDRALLMDAGECIYAADPKAVIARYKQLVHAPPREVAKIREQILALRETAAMPLPGDSHAGRLATPPSRVDVQGSTARILDLHVTDLGGAPVDHLHSGENYRFTYDVEFREPAEQVRFGMMIKPVVGVELAGQVSHEAGTGIEKVSGGARVRVAFDFRAALCAGAYFLNAGVLGVRDGQEQYLHRILDGAMFRVLPMAGGHATGRVDLTLPGNGPRIEIVREGV
ncbi:MAG: ABC transporter ATP-binding protein, partial [bacterium]|nr:ABC transporter ATP-binding protein [bacterium]